MKITKVLLCVSFALILSTSTAPSIEKPNWMTTGSYMTYEQVFVWTGHSESHNMTWEITKIEGNSAYVNTTSYTFNSSNSALTLIQATGNFTVNTETRNITSCSVEPSPIGLKWPFWIETNLTLGSEADTYFYNSIIIGSEVLSVLGQQRDTWITQHAWSPTSSMTRWYDKASSIVLKIYTTIQRNNVQIQVTETTKSTNISLPPSEATPQNTSPWIWPFALAAILVVAIVIITVAASRRRRSPARSKNDTKPKT
jgi:hypothetical protein